MIKCEISKENDVMIAVIKIKKFAADLGFNEVNQSMIMTASSEIGRNIVFYAGKGTITIKEIKKDSKSW